ncbi:MAG: hypothetical protein M1321_00935 [Candidatus Marsarchaeota archaeon]|nr:hypothetical protein [Candidatus Marsarchaeota archaeon]
MAALLGQYDISIAVYIIGIMIAVGGMILGIGYALNERRLKEFGRNELFESLFNGVIVGSMFLLFAPHGIITSIIAQATMTNGTSLNCDAFMANNTAMCLAYDYLASPEPYTFMGITHTSVLSTATTAISELLLLNGGLGLIAGININAIVAQFSFSYIFSPVISELQYIIKLLGTVAIAAVVQSSVLEFASVGTLAVLLPAGIILRTFYPTRKIGGFLMATSMGLYVVLPMSYVLNAIIINSYSLSMSQPGTSITQITSSVSGFRGSLISNESFMENITNSTKRLERSNGVLGWIGSAISGISGMLSDMVNWLLNVMAYLIVYAFVLPIFSLIITGISIRELSGMLGAEAFFGRFNIL